MGRGGSFLLPLPQEGFNFLVLKTEGPGLEGALRLFVEGECQVSLGFLPSGIAGTSTRRSECLWQIHAGLWGEGLAAAQGCMGGP